MLNERLNIEMHVSRCVSLVTEIIIITMENQGAVEDGWESLLRCSV